MFSIIIPLYNKAPYIEKAIQSVAAQSFQDFELIVMDDGSTDDSLANAQHILANLTPPLGGWGVVEQENRGVSTTRNNGVKLARYDYIAFLDADDWWEPTYLEEMKGLIEQYPEGGLYSSSYYKVLRGRHIPAIMGVANGFTEGVIDYFEVYARTMYQPVWTGATVIRKEIFNEFKGFNPRLKMGEDFDLWYRVALKYPVVLLNQPLAYYNQDVDQVNRAIGTKLYAPEEHLLFSDYSALKNNAGFRHLYEVLALYGLRPYYLANKNRKEVERILAGIQWKNHPLKYRLQYKILPKDLLKIYLWLKNKAYNFKTLLIKQKNG